jgi:hypothetical protein
MNLLKKYSVYRHCGRYEIIRNTINKNYKIKMTSTLVVKAVKVRKKEQATEVLHGE